MSQMPQEHKTSSTACLFERLLSWSSFGPSISDCWASLHMRLWPRVRKLLSPQALTSYQSTIRHKHSEKLRQRESARFRVSGQGFCTQPLRRVGSGRGPGVPDLALVYTPIQNFIPNDTSLIRQGGPPSGYPSNGINTAQCKVVGDGIPTTLHGAVFIPLMG